MSGESEKNSALHNQLQASLQEIVGPNHDVQLGKINLAFSATGLISVASHDVVVINPTTRQVVAQLDKVRFGAKLWETLFGNPSFDSLIIDNGWLDASQFSTDAGFPFPAHMKDTLSVAGKHLDEISLHASNGRFKSLEIRNSIVSGIAKHETTNNEVILSELILIGDLDGKLRLDAKLKSSLSDIVVVAGFERKTDQSSVLVFEGRGLRLNEFLPSPLDTEGAIGSNAIMGVSGNIPFGPGKTPQQGLVTLTFGESDLRIGRETTRLHTLVANLRLIPAKNQVELERSPYSAGGFTAHLVGGIRPVDPQMGYAGALQFELIAEKAEFAPTIENEPVVPAAFKIGGFWRPAISEIEISKASMLTNNGNIDATGVFGVANDSPSIRGQISSSGISLHAVKQFWPYFIGSPARKWVHEHLIDGRFENILVTADIPSGIIGNLREGKRMAPEHLQMDAEFKDASFLSVGDLPRIYDASGTVKLTGMKFETKLKKGKIDSTNSGTAKLSDSTFSIEDFAAKPAQGKTNVAISGAANVLAGLSEHHPFRVMSRIKTKAAQFRGKSHADIVARFPLIKQPKESDIEWNALVDLKQASSTRKISGRKISNATILIDANPDVAHITGSATIDGIHATLNVTEPLGKNSKQKRIRKFSATLDQATQKKVGLKLSPVISGPIYLKVEQHEGKPEFQHLDLVDAEINLPWIGWRKGAGIPAKAVYTLESRSGVNIFKNFSIDGKGFSARGNLVFDKKGIVSAKMTNVVLNAGDDFSFDISREGQVFTVIAKGKSFDARGIVKKLVHDGSFKKTQGKTSVTVKASIDRLNGFENLTIANAEAFYSSKDGSLNRLKLTGKTPESKPLSVSATKKDGRTGFEFRAEDAGHALGFVDIYNRMRGGKLYAALHKTGDGPYSGLVKVKKFDVVNEPRLAKLVRTTSNELDTDRSGNASRKLKSIKTGRVRFSLARARIVKGEGFLTAKDGLVRNAQIGLTFDGTVYDTDNAMNIRGTFMPAFGINLAVSVIPIIGHIFGNARNSALIGISYRLKGPMKSPTLQVNPMSIVTPGIFNKVFEFRE